MFCKKAEEKVPLKSSWTFTLFPSKGPVFLLLFS